MPGDVHDVSFTGFGGRRIRGWLLRPAGAGPATVRRSAAGLREHEGGGHRFPRQLAWLEPLMADGQGSAG
ncbi:hypothetical protein [uncultured Cellulomonas sp.]|uniref:hypothetical protein n=1 Tax=uncultured Cellulomonas sp. TaxID=189682 RepID=UPI00260B47CC|nr:hypothetical protein [uncultured Cellulomonas sp.]